MPKPQGYLTITDPEKGKSIEADTFTCAHCNSISIIKIKSNNVEGTGGMCLLCYKLICDPCVDQGECTPFEKKLEQMEQRARFLRKVDES